MTPITVLTARQVRAAGRIRRRLPYWNKADAALTKLADTMPGFDPTTTLLKVVAVNQLYGANLYAFHRMADHICTVLKDGKQRSPELVERIADLPATSGQTSRHHVSFASKFCHFFVDETAFPIFDSYAEWTVRFHLGRGQVHSNEHRYIAFLQNAHQLTAQAGLNVTPNELDRYLWIRGVYEAWRRHPQAPVNVELRQLFEKQQKNTDLRVLTGDA